jgi:hypothetical protein
MEALKMSKSYYAIQVIGYGKRRVYCIKRVTDAGGLILPVNGKAYKTLEKAQTVASELGLTIEKVGDTYEII